MTFNTLPKFAGALFKRISRIACGLLVMLVFNSTTLAVDLLYVSLGNNTIVAYDTTGTDGTAIAATLTVFANTYLNDPQGIAFDSSGNFYAANHSSNSISKFNSAGAFVSDISTNLNTPSGLAFDSSGNLYAANYGDNTISKYNSSGEFLSTLGNGNLNFPSGLAFDTSGNLYAANNGGGTIIKFSSAGTITTYVGNAFGLAFDSSGSLYAANMGQHTIDKYNSSGEFLSTLGNGNLNFPMSLAFDTSGNLYAANVGNATISKFDPVGNFLTSWSTWPSAPIYIAFKPVSVPEPSTYALATIATGVMAYLAHRRKARTV